MSSWKALSLLAVALLRQDVSYEGTVDPVTAIGRLDVSCIFATWRIKGVLWCPYKNNWKPCLWVENAYPCGLLEVVRQPMKSHVMRLPEIRGTTSGHNEAQLQFGEARVFTFIPPVVQNLDIPIAAPRGAFFAINYISELDSAGWRTGLLDSLFSMTKVKEKVGAWGDAYPRCGFVQQPSEPIAAHLQAVRAGKVAAAPLGRVFIQPYPFEPRVGHRMQLISPSIRGCVPIGTPLLKLLETGTGSPWGAYLFVHWGLFEECKRCLSPRLLPPRPPV